jgi:hypothetical protein
MPLYLPLKIALLITTAILGPGDIAPNKQTMNTCAKVINVIMFKKS